MPVITHRQKVLDLCAEHDAESPDVLARKVDTLYDDVYDFLRAERASILARGDGRCLASADDEQRIEKIDALLNAR